MRPFSISDVVRKTLGLNDQETDKPASGWLALDDSPSSESSFQRSYSSGGSVDKSEPLLASIKLSVLNFKHVRGILVEIESVDSSTIVLKVLGESHLLKECCLATHHINSLIEWAETQETK